MEEAFLDLEDQLSQGHTQAFLDVLEWHSKFWRYSLGNTILIAIQRPTAIRVAGYKTWVKLGFNVRQGESGIAIRAPWLRKFTDPTTGEVTERLVGYIPTYVFDISQTAEYPEKQPPTIYTPVPGDWSALYEHLQLNILVKGVMVSDVPLPGDIHGINSDSHIRINESLDPFYKVTCMIHEYVHHVAHGTPETREALTRNQREWEAEQITFMVCKAIGIDHQTARDYLLAYGYTTEALAESAKRTHTLVKRIMEDLYLLQDLPSRRQDKDTIAA